MRLNPYVLLSMLLFASLPASGQDWPQWRGPYRDGVATGRALWTSPGRDGENAALVRADDHVFVLNDRAATAQ